jgi:hypothetical protein
MLKMDVPDKGGRADCPRNSEAAPFTSKFRRSLFTLNLSNRRTGHFLGLFAANLMVALIQL